MLYLNYEKYKDANDGTNSQTDCTNHVDEPKCIDFEVGPSVEKFLYKEQVFSVLKTAKTHTHIIDESIEKVDVENDSV